MFKFSERAFNRAFQFEDGPKSLTGLPSRDQNKTGGQLIHESTNNSAKKTLMEDFWLPKVSGALNKGKKKQSPSGVGHFQHVVSFRIWVNTLGLKEMKFYVCFI